MGKTLGRGQIAVLAGVDLHEMALDRLVGHLELKYPLITGRQPARPFEQNAQIGTRMGRADGVRPSSSGRPDLRITCRAAKPNR